MVLKSLSKKALNVKHGAALHIQLLWRGRRPLARLWRVEYLPPLPIAIRRSRRQERGCLRDHLQDNDMGHEWWKT